MNKFRILVFPCGSEIGLEIYRSLRYSSHVEIFGASSVDDHGLFVYENYINGVPYIDSDDAISCIAKIVSEYKIDAIYPTMDKVIWRLKADEEKLGCKVIASSSLTTDICLSKTKTYAYLKDIIKVPHTYTSVDEISQYPVFVKPDIGYGTRGVYIAANAEELSFFIKKNARIKHVMTEYLPGKEYTVDCFTDRHGILRFSSPRARNRISNGISVNTKAVDNGRDEFIDFANKINDTIKFRGAWFLQAKRDKSEKLTLLEIAARLGGSSALFRGLGINFALLSIYDAFDIDIDILLNEYEIELDRALDNKYKISLEYSTVYIDFDDCLLVNGKLNTKLVEFLHQAFNNDKRIVLLSKHDGNLDCLLKRLRIYSIFDEIYHIGINEHKYDYITDKNGIFIDDSFSERKQINSLLGIQVFSPDMIETLMD